MIENTDPQHLLDCLGAIALAIKNDQSNYTLPVIQHIERILTCVPKTPAQTSFEILLDAMQVDTKQTEKLQAIDAITKSTASDLLKLQNIGMVLAGTARPEYFIDPPRHTVPGDGIGGFL